jgi:hypothetical protein
LLKWTTQYIHLPTAADIALAALSLPLSHSLSLSISLSLSLSLFFSLSLLTLHCLWRGKQYRSSNTASSVAWNLRMPLKIETLLTTLGQRRSGVPLSIGNTKLCYNVGTAILPLTQTYMDLEGIRVGCHVPLLKSWEVPLLVDHPSSKNLAEGRFFSTSFHKKVYFHGKLTY